VFGRVPQVAIGYDEGTVMVKLGHEMPVASMDKTGKLIVAVNNVVSAAAVRLTGEGDLEDGDRWVPWCARMLVVLLGVRACLLCCLVCAHACCAAWCARMCVAIMFVLLLSRRIPLSLKELGNIEVFPQTVNHNANGRFVAVCGDNEYVIYTAQALRNKSFGAALDFVWSPYGSGDYAIRESSSKIKVFKNFKVR
jgi:coatomer subunit beta'